jgi:hypothetical protein
MLLLTDFTLNFEEKGYPGSQNRGARGYWLIALKRCYNGLPWAGVTHIVRLNVLNVYFHLTL